MKPRRRISTALAVLFGLPFCIAGLVFGYRTVAAISRSDWPEAGLTGIFALVFGGAGVGFLFLISVGAKRLAETGMVRARYHDEPWNWRPEWREGRISGSTRTSAGFAWLFALLWNLISLPGTLAAAGELRESPDARLYFALIFPAVGIGLLIWALRATWRHLRFGSCVLHLDRVPGVIGHGIGGTIVTGFENHDVEKFELKLTCVRRRTSGSGRSRSTRESILWQEEKSVGRYEATIGAGQTRIPFRFAIPGDVEPTDELRHDDRVTWRLSVSAAMPGVDFATRFEVPVFRTAESAEPAPPGSFDPSHAEELDDPAATRSSRIRVEENADVLELFFPAGRNPGAALDLFMFVVIWSGLLVFMIRHGAPIVFPIVFGLFELLLVTALARMVLASRRVEATRDRIRLSARVPLWTFRRSIAREEIEAVQMRIGMQVAERPYYDIQLTLRNGRRVTAGGSIRDKREAEWITELLRDRLGFEKARRSAAG